MFQDFFIGKTQETSTLLQSPKGNGSLSPPKFNMGSQWVYWTIYRAWVWGNRLTCYPMAATLQFSQNMDNGFLVASLHSWSITSINLPGLCTLDPPGKRYSKSVNKGPRGAAGFPGRIPPMALPHPPSLRECQQPSSLILTASWDRSGWWLLSLEAKFFSRWSYPLPLLTSSQVSMQWKSL